MYFVQFEPLIQTDRFLNTIIPWGLQGIAKKLPIYQYYDLFLLNDFFVIFSYINQVPITQPTFLHSFQ